MFTVWCFKNKVKTRIPQGLYNRVDYDVTTPFLTPFQLPGTRPNSQLTQYTNMRDQKGDCMTRNI